MSKPPPIPPFKDHNGSPIPKDLSTLWKNRHEGTYLQWLVTTALDILKQAKDSKDPLWSEVPIKSVMALLDNASQQLQVIEPYALCPVCRGFAYDKCTACCGRGMVSKWRLEHVFQNKKQ
jgi:hypothetical protein